ncbi:MAG: alpha/beta fold hydrolase [Parvularculaceae bacterium]|nr:alpha/beta fold hydrolase [Parvularculaceae bacterium]
MSPTLLALFALQTASTASVESVEELNRQADGVTFRSEMVQVSGGNLHSVVGGDGPLILFVHGFPSYWYHFHGQMMALAGDYRVVAIDALGAGASSKPTDVGSYKIDQLADQIDQVATYFAPGEPFILVGHDWVRHSHLLWRRTVQIVCEAWSAWLRRRIVRCLSC